MTFKQRASVGGALLALAIPGYSGTFTADFNSNTAPEGTTVQGTQDGNPRTDVIEDGILKLTKNVNGQAGSIIIDDLDAFAPVYGFDFKAKVRAGGGTATPADGFSISYDPFVTDGALPGEEGTTGGLAFAFDVYLNAGETTPTIDLKVGGTTVASRAMTLAEMLTGDNFTDLHINVAPDGKVNLTYNGIEVFTDLYFPNYEAIPGGRFVIGARTGGLNLNQWFDNIQITTYTEPNVGIVQPPASQKVLAGSDAIFSIVANNAEEATYQWFLGGTQISGETGPTLTVSNVSLADTGAEYSVRVTGPNNTVTSEAGVLTVVDIPTPATPDLVFDFEEGTGLPPEGTTVWGEETGGGYISTFGGVNDSGVLHITDAVNSQRGAFIVEDAEAGAPVYGLTITAEVLLGSGSERPADGFSVNYASDIPDDPQGELENGIGTGLSILFDIYDNGGGEAPSIDIKYDGQIIASEKVPYSFLDTGVEYASLVIRMQTDGTVDVAYKDVIIFEDVLVPGFTSISDGRLAIGGRTGGQNVNMWFDNITLTTENTPGALRIATQPTAQLVASGSPVTFTVEANDTEGVTYQWLRDGEVITGATASTYTISPAAAADSGAEFSVRVTKNGTTVTSDVAALTVIDVSSPTVTFDFESGETPAGTVLYRSPVDTSTAGYIEGGVLHLTDAVNGQQGGFVVEPLLGGAEVSAFSAAFDLRMGGGSGNAADAFHFNFANDLPDGTAGVGGAGSGLTIEFDIYDNGGGEAPSIDVEYKNQLVAQTKLTKAEIETGDEFREVVVRVSQDGKLDLAFGDRILHQDLQLPDYTYTVNGEFGFYALTGGQNENFWVDNIRLQLTKSAAPLAISEEPADQLLLSGTTATFNVVLNDPEGATLQWYRNGQLITGETSATFTTPALTAADNGARYTVVATGPGGTVTSREAVVTVVDRFGVTSPTVSYDFEDGLQPENTFINGSTWIDWGYVHLSDAVNDQSGTFIIADPALAETANAMTAEFSILIGGTTGTPADGLSFVWGSDFPETVIFRESGTGEGLIISFDTYVNAGETSPAIEVFYKGDLIASRSYPNSVIRTGEEWADVAVRVEADGTLDLQYKDLAVFSNLQLPDYTPTVNGKFAFGGGTGGANDNHWIDNIQIETSVGETAPEITSISESNGEITITWTGGGTLQATDDLVNGEWTTLTGATSTYTTSNTGEMRFFRVIR